MNRLFLMFSSYVEGREETNPTPLTLDWGRNICLVDWLKLWWYETIIWIEYSRAEIKPFWNFLNQQFATGGVATLGDPNVRSCLAEVNQLHSSTSRTVTSRNMIPRYKLGRWTASRCFVGGYPLLLSTGAAWTQCRRIITSLLLNTARDLESQDSLLGVLKLPG